MERRAEHQEDVPLHRIERVALTLASTLTLFAANAGAVVPTQIMYEPSAYTSFADSPFYPGTPSTYFYLQTFEPGNSATPGYSSPTSGFVSSPSQFSDSVDADDGAINGSGNGGYAWYSANATSTMTFVFDANVLGTLPTHVGLVWTDVGIVSSGGLGVTNVTFSAYAADNSLIGTTSGLGLGDGNALGGTAEDRFFGAYSAGGIARIEMSVSNSVDWEVDHLQYGTLNPVPEPEQWLLMALGLAGVATVARRRRSAA